MDSLAVMAAPPVPWPLALPPTESEGAGFASLLEQSQEALAPVVGVPPPMVQASPEPLPMPLDLSVVDATASLPAVEPLKELQATAAEPADTDPAEAPPTEGLAYAVAPQDVSTWPPMASPMMAPAPLPHAEAELQAGLEAGASIPLGPAVAGMALPAPATEPVGEAMTGQAGTWALPAPRPGLPPGAPAPASAEAAPPAAAAAAGEPHVSAAPVHTETAPGLLTGVFSTDLVPEAASLPGGTAAQIAPVAVPLAAGPALSSPATEAPATTEGEVVPFGAERPGEEGEPPGPPTPAPAAAMPPTGEPARAVPPARDPSPAPQSHDVVAGLGAASVGAEAAPIEAPRAEAPAPPAPPPPARQVAPVAIALAFAPALGQFSVALDPPQLGHVEIAVQRGGDGHQVRILAERPETLALLERDRGELDRALAEAGVAVGEGGLSFGLAQDSGRGGQPSGGREGEAGRVFRPSPAGLAAPGPNTVAATPRGLLDLRI